MATAFVERCKATYYALRDAQLQRVDEFAVGYDTDRDVYFNKVEPRVRYRDVMVAVAAELRAERAAERAEVERWERAERGHYAVWVDDAMSDDITETTDVLFPTRLLAAVWSAVRRPRRAVGVPAPRRPSGHLSRRVPAGRGRRRVDIVASTSRSTAIGQVGRGPPRRHVLPHTYSHHLSLPPRGKAPPCSLSYCSPHSS